MTQKWLRLAFAELWPAPVREVIGGQHNPRIIQYHERTTLKATEDEVAWCSAFACWCMEQAGTHSTRSARARSWLAWGIAAEYAEVGAIVVLRRAGVTAGPEVMDAPGHVGFVVSLAAPSSVDVLGGNQGNAVSIARYPLDQVLGFRLPAEIAGG